MDISDIKAKEPESEVDEINHIVIFRFECPECGKKIILDVGEKKS